MNDPAHHASAQEIGLDLLSFGTRKPGLFGEGLTAKGTSCGEDDYRRLSVWNERLSGLVAPVFPDGEPRPGYRYLRLPGRGEGALLRRFPGGGDGRGSTAQAVIGPDLRMPQAVFAALGGWPDLHEWLERPDEYGLEGWRAEEPFRGLMDEAGRQRAREIKREAAEREDLTPLVALLLRAPGTAVDIPVPGAGPLAAERDRLVLLWGVYQVLRDILGTEEQQPTPFNDWSFSTCEPGPSVDTWPRFAFYTGAGPGAAPPWHGIPEDPYLELARWLVGEFAKKGRGALAGLGGGPPPTHPDAYVHLIKALLGRARAERPHAARPSVPSTAAPSTTTQGPAAAPAPEDNPEWAAPRNPTAPPDTGTGPDTGTEPVAASTPAAPAAPPSQNTPAQNPPPHEPPTGHTADPPPTAHLHGPVQKPGPPVPVAPPHPSPLASAHDPWRDATWREELYHLSAQLSATREPERVAELATQIVEHHQPEFGRRLKVGGASLNTVFSIPAWVLYLVTAQLLLLVCFLLVSAAG